MPASDVRVGFIGCGEHAVEVLLPAVQQVGLDLAAICDLDKRRAQRATRRFGAFRAYQDLQRMIDEMDLDAVLVCGPPELHAEAATVALHHGCHVWTEAPPAPTAAEAERIGELARERGLVAQAGLMMRFAPAYRRLRATIADEAFGAPVAFEAIYWPPALPGHDEPLLFDALHILDLVRWLLGEVAECSMALEDERAAISLRMLDGATGVVSFLRGGPWPREMVTVGSDAAVATAVDRASLTVRRRGSDEMTVWRAEALAAGGQSDTAHLRGYLPALVQFAADVADDAPQEATISAAAATMHLIERLHRDGEV